MIVKEAKNPTMTLTPDEIRFSPECFNLLGDPEYVYLFSHPYQKTFLLIVGRHDRMLFDCKPVRWREEIIKSDTRETVMGRDGFARQLYQSWELDLEKTYQSAGFPDDLEGMPSLRFDFYTLPSDPM